MDHAAGRAIAVFGTASDVGKSVVATALCRHLADRGHDVAPFKAQNMSNNSGVTRDGLEMGRAQIVQALAARAEPHVDMNPVLLKPSSDRRSQVVLLGRALAERDAGAYFSDTSALRDATLAALGRLRAQHDVIVVEGAGSCAEVNLRRSDFVNFATAHAADAPVLLVADIDRGGVFAQVVGTLEVLPDEDRTRVAGVIVNRFRGDAALFDDGVSWLEARAGLPVLGVVPFLPDLGIDAEDAVVLHRAPSGTSRRAPDDRTAWIGVVRLPHISNFTDFDPLAQHPRATLRYVDDPARIADHDLVILPGSKAVRADLEWLRARGLWDALRAYERDGGRVAGVCGGYQMLGQTLDDLDGVEGPPGRTEGLGLLDVATTFQPDKRLTRMRGRCPTLDAPVWGYEIHFGATERGAVAPWLEIAPESADGVAAPTGDGAIRADGRVFGTYLHGVFDSPALVTRLLDALGAAPGPEPELDPSGAIDRLTDHFRRHVDVAAIEKLIGLHDEAPRR